MSRQAENIPENFAELRAANIPWQLSDIDWHMQRLRSEWKEGGGEGATGTDPEAGQDNEKYFHIANKVILPRRGKTRQDRSRHYARLC